MLSNCIYHILNQILPSTGKPKHDTHRLEYICACKIMHSESDTAIEMFRNLPPTMFEPVLQAGIYNCYLKYINSLDTSTPYIYGSDIDIAFPETMVILILNWPEEDFKLRNQISSLEPPIILFPTHFSASSQAQSILGRVAMFEIFTSFTSRLV